MDKNDDPRRRKYQVISKSSSVAWSELATAPMYTVAFVRQTSFLGGGDARGLAKAVNVGGATPTPPVTKS